MTVDSTQQKVRQRARFLCENSKCRKSTEGYYAHIIPESWQGEYAVSNILFLCDECHRKFDYSVFKRDSALALNYLNMIRDSKKNNDFIVQAFYFLAHKIIVKIGAGITLEDCKSIFDTANHKPLLSIRLINNRISIDGKFFNQKGDIILEIKDNRFFSHGSLLWDLYIKTNGELNLISEDKQIYINIKQNGDSSLNLTGRIFIEGDIFEINEKGIYQPSRRNLISKCYKRGGGIILSKDKLAL